MIFGGLSPGFPVGAFGKEPTCQCRRHRRGQFDPLDREDPLEEGMATHSNILAWRIPWTEDPGRATVHSVTKSQIQLKQLGTGIGIWWNVNTYENTQWIIIFMYLTNNCVDKQ